MDDNYKQRFLGLVAQDHGDEVRDACARILAEKEQQGAMEFSPLDVRHQAQRQVYKDQIKAAKAAGLQGFDSDGDL